MQICRNLIHQCRQVVSYALTIPSAGSLVLLFQRLHQFKTHVHLLRQDYSNSTRLINQKNPHAAGNLASNKSITTQDNKQLLKCE